MVKDTNYYIAEIRKNHIFDGFIMVFDRVEEENKKNTVAISYKKNEGLNNHLKYKDKNIIPEGRKYDVDCYKPYVEIFKKVLEKRCEDLGIDNIFEGGKVEEDNGRYVITLNTTGEVPEYTDIRLDTLYPFTNFASSKKKEIVEIKNKNEKIVNQLFTRTRTIGGMLPIPHIKNGKFKNMSLNTARGGKNSTQEDNPTDHMVFVKRWYDVMRTDADYEEENCVIKKKLNDSSSDEQRETRYSELKATEKPGIIADDKLVELYKEYKFWFDAIGSYDNYIKLLYLEAFDPYTEGGVAFTQRLEDYDKPSTPRFKDIGADKTFIENATEAFEKRSESIVDCYNAAIEENK
ncbi:hypothetical protein [Vagococcus fessus]|uniref:Uncharacterized protein n=1 Tax=Vagococcus fessus TaxID=120370 RepID=A0A430A6E1_9ENTE|nr:hypothetical protein [Vagococcus fessus]RSU02428.1 hypothetical protein CBF31_08650 [Vagococcus fessus]